MRETYSVRTPLGYAEVETDTQKLLNKVRLALRITTDAFDPELRDLIRAAKQDLSVSGVVLRKTDRESIAVLEDADPDPLIVNAVIMYCKLYFGEPDKAETWDRLKAAYDTLKAQLSMTSGYRVERT